MKVTLSVLMLLAFALLAEAGDPEHFALQEAGKYPLSVCPISGETLGEMGDPVVRNYDGREVKFCCPNCVGTFEKDLAASMKILDRKIIEAEQATYPLNKCVVSGETLGGMGDPVMHMYKNQLVKFCCENCIESFEKDPAKYLAMIRMAEQNDEAPAEEKAE
ncbi:MAG: hypothetical protein H6508_01250 [Calditrichaeota bacterium]|nr:hypothetical protein [Calditrichota bacterium]MCB9365803.1 hypothetical protein [Calditrichota bacterium]